MTDYLMFLFRNLYDDYRLYRSRRFRNRTDTETPACMDSLREHRNETLYGLQGVKTMEGRQETDSL